jgi:hypothetical protein
MERGVSHVICDTILELGKSEENHKKISIRIAGLSAEI